MRIKQQYLSTVFLNSVSPSSHVRFFLLAQGKKKKNQWEYNEHRMSHSSLQNGFFFNLLKAKEN